MRLTLIILLATGLRLMAQSPGDLMDLSVRLLEEGNYRLSEENLRMFISRYPYREYDIGDAYYRLGQVSMYQGQLDSARQYNERSMELRRQLAAEELGKNHLLEGHLQLLRANPVASLAALERAAQFPFIDDPLLPAEVQRLMGAAYLQAVELDAARVCNEQAELIVEVLEGANAPAQFPILLQKAQLAVRSGSSENATAYLKTALELADGDRQKGRVLQLLAEQALLDGDFPAALSYADEGLRAEWDRSAVFPAALHLRAAEALMLQGDGAARERIQAALMQLVRGFRPRSFSDNPAERAVTDSSLLIRAFELKALTLLANHQAEPSDSLLEQALYCADRGLQLLESYLAASGPQRLRAISLRSHSSLYDLGIAAALWLAESSGNKNYELRALQLLDRAHRFEQHQAWQEAYAGLSGAALHYPSLQAKMKEQEALLALYEGKVFLVSIAMDAGQSGAALSQQEYPSAEKASGAGASPLVHAYLSPAESLGASRQQLDLQAMRSAVENDQPKAFSKAAWAVSERLLQPLAPVIKEKQSLRVSALGPVRELPVEWLLTDAPGKWWVKWHRLDFLGAQQQLCYTLRPGEAGEAPEALTQGRWLGVLPGFEADSAYSQVTGLPAKEAEIFNYAAVGPEGNIRPQPAMASNFISYADELGTRFEARVLTGASATETTLRKAAGQADWLHFNAPVFRQPLISSESGFLLAQAEGAAAADGWLRLSELKDRPTAAQAAVVEQVPAAMQPLVMQAFGFAGVQQLVFAQKELPAAEWKAFYERGSQMDWESALLQLRQSRLKNPKTASPQHWLGLRLYRAPR